MLSAKGARDAERVVCGMTASRIGFAVVVTLVWFGLLALFVPLPLSAPLASSTTQSIDGAAFTPVIGSARRDGDSLVVTAMAGAQGAMQVHQPTQPIDAGSLPILRYRFEELPRMLELVFLFRRADQPDDVKVLTVPGVGGRAGAVDLSRLPEWDGQIIEIGFAEFPGAQSVPPSRAFRSFDLAQVEFQSRSWLSALAVRRDDWFGRQSWELMSLSAIGPDSDRPRGWPLPPLLFFGVVTTLLAGMVLLGWRGRQLMPMAVIGFGLAWVMLDLRWLHDLHGRHAGTRAIYGGLPAQERALLQPDQAVFDGAARIRAALADEHPDTRVFVDAGSTYARARLLYHLLQLNVAPVDLVHYGTPEQRAGSIVVLFDARAPRFDTQTGLLHFSDRSMPATPILIDGALRIFRVGEAP